MTTKTTTASDQPPLSFMTKLSPVVYYYKPSAPSTSASTAVGQAPPPRLLLLASWMGAREAHIAKYVRPYQRLFPTSAILLLRFETRHFFPNFPWTRRALLSEYTPAVPILQAVAEDLESSEPATLAGNTRPQILIHIWSNGGSISLHTVHNLFKKATTRPFPRHAIIFDSTPGLFSYKPAVRVMNEGIKSPLVRMLVAPIFHGLMAWYWFFHIVLSRWIPSLKGFLETLADGHNDLSVEFGGRALTEVRRSYIYGPGDEVIMEDHVVGHAEDAKRKGLAMVRRERFLGTKHVQHVRGNEERYWRIVEETWDGVGFGNETGEQLLS
ncbi:Eukaryotic protein of unknown function (DUF829) domain containing protein [Rhypophila decipiens]